jgi:Glycosyl transferases group 1
MRVSPRVLVVWGQYPRWMPPVLFSDNQVTLAAKLKTTGAFKYQNASSFNYFKEFEPNGWLEGGAFDLGEYCERNRLGRDFDFIIVFVEQDTGLFPKNIGYFNCPAILLVGDTHHFPRPISALISYARDEGFAFIVCQFTAHHLHWFVKAGFARCIWVPGLITRHEPGLWHAVRDDNVIFVGHDWKYHFYRHTLLRTLQDEGLPLRRMIGTREQAAQAYSRSLISFNCSLNSDINIRNFEVLSSQGFLLTDDLPEVTGFRQLFRPGEACETYVNGLELLSKIRFYRANPHAALKIARRGHELFCTTLPPAHALRRLKAVLFEDNWSDNMLPPDQRCYSRAGDQFWRRLKLYEDVQELHRKQLSVRVLVEDGIDWFEPDDFLDLPRVSFYSARPRRGCRPAPATNMASSVWDYIILD